MGMFHRQIIDEWPSLSDFAADLGVPYGTAKAMRRRGSIPPEHWSRVVAAASDRSIDGVSMERLAALRAARRETAQVAA